MTKTKSSSTLLDGKSESEILAPDPIRFTWKGKQYDIYPMPDSVLMKIGDSLADVSRLFDGIASLNIDGRSFSELTNSEKLQIVAPVIPQVVRMLVPNASRIIAGCLRIDETTVTDEMRIADKLDALRSIVLSEDLPRIVGNFDALVKAFVPAGQATL